MIVFISLFDQPQATDDNDKHVIVKIGLVFFFFGEGRVLAS